jgi:hypothetical protein
MTQVEGWRFSVELRWPVGALCAAATFAVPAAAGGQDPAAPPCQAGVMAAPAFTVVDEPESGGTDTHDYASHPMTIAAAFPLAAEADTFGAVWTLPPTFTVLPPAPVRGLRDDTVSATVEGIPQAAGAYPVSVAWTQTDGTRDGRCSGSATTSLAVTAATQPKLRRPRVTPGLPDESTVNLVLARHGGDLRPLEVHVRWVRAQRFPGAHAHERVVTVPQLASDPAFAHLSGTVIHAGGVRINVDPTLSEQLNGLRFIVQAHASFTRQSIPFGYEIDVRQGGRTASRLRVAGHCRFFVGLVSCKTRRVSLS